MPRPPLPRRRVLAVLAALALGGCGGGIWFGIGDGDDPPNASLAASPDAAFAGEVVRLVAAASDDFAVDHVAFYRVDQGGGATLLARVATPPYQLDIVLPATGASVVQYFARAVDDVGQTGDSALVGVTVLR